MGIFLPASVRFCNSKAFYPLKTGRSATDSMTILYVRTFYSYHHLESTAYFCWRSFLVAGASARSDLYAAAYAHDWPGITPADESFFSCA